MGCPYQQGQNGRVARTTYFPDYFPNDVMKMNRQPLSHKLMIFDADDFKLFHLVQRACLFQLLRSVRTRQMARARALQRIQRTMKQPSNTGMPFFVSHKMPIAQIMED